MADKIIHFPGAEIGIYAIIRHRADGSVWNGTALVAWVDLNVDTYDIALAFVGGDAYAFTVPTTLPTNKTYTVAFYKRATSATPATTGDTKLSDEWEFGWNGTTSTVAAPGAADWRYALQQDVVNLLGANNLRIISNVDDDDAAIDTARVQAAGEWADAWMDARFASLGYVTPLTGTTTGTDLLVTDANVKLTVWKLNLGRVIASVAGETPAEVAAVMNEHKKDAEDFFRSLSMRSISITADRLYARGSKIEAYVPSGSSVTWCQL